VEQRSEKGYTSGKQKDFLAKERGGFRAFIEICGNRKDRLKRKGFPSCTRLKNQGGLPKEGRRLSQAKTGKEREYVNSGKKGKGPG